MTSNKKENQRNSLPPGQAPIKKLLRWGIDHPGITQSNPKIDLSTYNLMIDAEVEKRLKLSWSKIAKIPRVHTTSDFHCVEG